MENSLNRLFDLFEGLKEQMSWKCVFGEPQIQGERTIIPVSAIQTGLGMGFQWGTQTGPSHEAAATDEEPSFGGGTGIVGRPVAIIEITPEKTTVRPVIDYARLILAGLFAIVCISALWTGVLNKVLRSREAQHA